MRNLSSQDCQRLRDLLGEGIGFPDALSKAVGETQASAGIWRFFSDKYPDGGIRKWNSDSAWRIEWGLPTPYFHSFGEDIFGNQIIICPNMENVLLWSHENGDVIDLFLDPVALLETVVESGLEWIDFYRDGLLNVTYKRIADVPQECHLHWTTPLILGGLINPENTSVVECVMHLTGHAKLWRQLSSCDPGNTIILKNKQK